MAKARKQEETLRESRYFTASGRYKHPERGKEAAADAPLTLIEPQERDAGARELRTSRRDFPTRAPGSFSRGAETFFYSLFPPQTRLLRTLTPRGHRSAMIIGGK